MSKWQKVDAFQSGYCIVTVFLPFKEKDGKHCFTTIIWTLLKGK